MAKRNNKLESRSAKVKFPYQRQLKVRSGHYYHHYADFTPHKNHSPAPVPFVNIQGYWLNQAGFTIGTALNVKVSKGRIVLSASPSG